MQKNMLQPNESIIMKSERVLYGSVLSGYINELILTNMNIILIKKGIFGKIKNIEKFPLGQIRLFNGRPSVLVASQNNGFPQLEVYFVSNQVTFGFESKKEATKWVNNINQVISGNIENIDFSESKGIPGTEFIAETFVDTFKTFKAAIKSKGDNRHDTSLDKTAKKCLACGAPISGLKGKIIRCQYCDTNQELS